MALKVRGDEGSRKAEECAAREERRARFKSALALARKTAKEWAAENGVTETHLYAVLKGPRTSARLVAKVEGFVAQYLPPVAAA